MKKMYKHISHYNGQSTSLRLVLKPFSDDEFLTEIGSECHILGAAEENDRSNKEVCDLGTDNVPLTDDLRLRLWVSETGFNKFVIYSGVSLFRALYVSIDLLYARRLLIGCHPNSLNIVVDGVL